MEISNNTPLPENETFQELLGEFAQILNVPLEKLPGDDPVDKASEFLSIAPQTLAIWRSTGRYSLPFLKTGRYIRYRTRDLVRYKMSRICQHTGQTKLGS